MFHSTTKVGLIAALFGLIFVSTDAWAQKKEARKVKDEAHFFSDAAINQVNDYAERIKEIHHKDFWVETVKEGPPKDTRQWAIDRYKKSGIDGVYVLITMEPKKHFEIVVGADIKKKLFTQADSDHAEQILRGEKPNDGIRMVGKYVLEQMNKHDPKPAPAPAPPVGDRVAPKKEEAQTKPVAAMPHQNDLFGWICIGAVVLLVVWIVIALIRAVSGAGSAPGYGGGAGYGAPGYGGGGGGGGGFFTGLLGGLFGAVAGNWVYNNFFGGHSSAYGASNMSSAAPGTGRDIEPSATGGDFDNADGGGGGKWQNKEDAGAGKDDAAGGGGDAGGGDAGGGGGGGGDFGGGGGDAGGGDFGGGGGDFGGGGGDFGGGGGDFGGGGGDLGGGGGDW